MFRIAFVLIALVTANSAWAGGFHLPIFGEKNLSDQITVETANISRTSNTLDIVITEQVGGNACCTTLTVITKTDDGWKTFEFIEPTSINLIKPAAPDDMYDEIVLDKIYHIENGKLVGRECEKFHMIGASENHKRCVK